MFRSYDAVAKKRGSYDAIDIDIEVKILPSGFMLATVKTHVGYSYCRGYVFLFLKLRMCCSFKSNSTK